MPDNVVAIAIAKSHKSRDLVVSRLDVDFYLWPWPVYQLGLATPSPQPFSCHTFWQTGSPPAHLDKLPLQPPKPRQPQPLHKVQDPVLEGQGCARGGWGVCLSSLYTLAKLEDFPSSPLAHLDETSASKPFNPSYT